MNPRLRKARGLVGWTGWAFWLRRILLTGDRRVGIIIGGEGARTSSNQLVRWSVIADCQLIARCKEKRGKCKEEGETEVRNVGVIERRLVKKRL